MEQVNSILKINTEMGRKEAISGITKNFCADAYTPALIIDAVYDLFFQQIKSQAFNKQANPVLRYEEGIAYAQVKLLLVREDVETF